MRDNQIYERLAGTIANNLGLKLLLSMAVPKTREYLYLALKPYLSARFRVVPYSEIKAEIEGVVKLQEHTRAN